ncbi:hypothetical protein AB0D32_03520 [Micromonospora sp. NPDC048170]|uniref:hypothetical protein n=1 Tax=Micromonospora sp. NPDC048170 TaxID=3154819 RepID=UPI0033FED27C
MIQLPICPVCNEPVADQPATDWTSAYRSGGAPWWHLADNSPICAAADGSSQVAFIEDWLPVDSETSSWLDTMSRLFAIDGPCDPARLGSAITAAEHLSRWLHTTTGPFSAQLALPTSSDAASLIGHLHRTTRLLARVHVQTGSHFLDQARQAHLTSLDDSEMRSEVIDAVDDIHTWLQDAADWSAQSAQASGAAWSSARKVAALTIATSTGPTDLAESPEVHATGRPRIVALLRGLARRLRLWAIPAKTERRGPTSPDVTQEQLELSPAHLAELIGSAFDDEAAFSPELTHTAARITATLATYLSNCLGPARSVAIPAPQDLADLAISLTYLTHTLISGLRHLVDSPRGSESDGLDEIDVALTRSSLRDAIDALRVAASHLAAVSYTAAGTDHQENQQ